MDNSLKKSIYWKYCMHELSVMNNILSIVLDYAKKYNATRVSAINLIVGELTDLIPHWMQNYFDFVSKDTIAEKAVLKIEKVPALLRCKKCSNEFQIKRDDINFSCTKCNSADVEIISGREFKVVSIEID